MMWRLGFLLLVVNVAFAGKAVQWHARVGASSVDSTPQLLHEAKLVLTTDQHGRIFANQENSGRLQWRIDTREQISTGVAMNRHAIVVGTHQARILAFEHKQHHLLWSYNLDSELIATPVLAGTSVVVKTVSGQVLVFDIRNGHLLWRYNHGAEPEIVLRNSSAPCVSGDKVITGFNDGSLLAFRLKDGQILWQTLIAGAKGMSQIDQVIDVTTTPVIKDNVVYVANYQGKLKALDLGTGQTLWEKEFSTAQQLSVDNKNIYAIDDTGQVFAFEQQLGSVIWRQPKFTGERLSAPVHTATAVLVGDQKGHLHWLAKEDGHVIRSVAIARSAIQARPLVEGKTIYTLSRQGRLSRYQADS
jgi:outer membrane protein assembly factor BamB